MLRFGKAIRNAAGLCIRAQTPLLPFGGRGWQCSHVPDPKVAMAIPTMVLVLAALLAVVSLAEPLAGRLRLPSSVILALLGILIGTASTLIGLA